MSEDPKEKLNETCEQTRKAECDRYYQTVILTLGLKDFLEKNAKECKFISTEPRFYIENGKSEIKPDIVLQYNHKNGVLCEIKTSSPVNEGYLFNSLKQLERYSQDALGWDTDDRKINDQEILLFCHMFDYDRVILKLNEWMETGKLTIAKNLCICEWGMVLYPKWGKEIILLRKRSGELSCKELDAFLTNNIRLDVNALHVTYEACKFTRKEPPVEYLMSQLWTDVFPAMDSTDKEFETTIDEILKIAYEFYIPWSNLEGEFSQIRKTWVKKAMNKFCEIGLAKKNPQVKGKYEIVRGKKIKNIQEYMIKSICKKMVKEKTKFQMNLDEDNNEQKPLDFFEKLL